MLRLICLLTGLLLTGVQLAGKPTAPPKDTPLRSFFYQYGGMVNPLITGIDAKKTEDGWVADFLLGLRDDIEGVPLTDQDVEALERLMADHKLWMWAGFEGCAPDVLDGENFSFSAGYADGTMIVARGANDFPKDYWNAKEAILSAVEEMLISRGISYGFE